MLSEIPCVGRTLETALVLAPGMDRLRGPVGRVGNAPVPSPGGIVRTKRSLAIRSPRAPRFPQDGAFHGLEAAPTAVSRGPRGRPAAACGARHAAGSQSLHREPVPKQNGELGPRLGPEYLRPLPLPLDLPQRQVDQLRRRVVRKVARPGRVGHAGGCWSFEEWAGSPRGSPRGSPFQKTPHDPR